MQAINSIQNAMINANAAAMQGALVVVSANAHRAYDLYDTRDTRVSKCPGKPSPSRKVPSERVEVRSRRVLRELGLFTTHETAGTTWRRDSHHGTTPAAIWATLVLNCTLCG